MDIKTILISDEIDHQVIERLQEANLTVEYQPLITPEKLKETIKDFDVLLVRSRTKVTKPIIESADCLKLIARAGVGVDNVDIDAASDKNVLVINAPSGNTISACEMTCCHILTLARPTAEACQSLRGGVWRRKDFIGTEVFGKTLAIIGLGRIGREVGVRMKAFGMKIIGYDPIVTADQTEQLGFQPVTLDELWPQADYITLHVPLINDTYHFIDKTTLSKCKSGVKIVNCARGGIIHEEALLEALESGKVSGAALDVFEQEPPRNEDLLRHPSVFVTPHLGASTHEAQARVGQEIVDEILDLIRGRNVVGAVNSVRLQ